MRHLLEHKDDPLLPFEKFIHRILKNTLGVLLLVAVSLFVGTVGYKFFEGMGWIDALFNASMILSGMGPATELHHDTTKIFASIYAIYSGLFLIGATGLLLLPFFHRLIHKFHHKI